MVMSDLGLETDAFVVVVLGGIDAARVKGWGFSRSGGWIVKGGFAD